MSKSYTACHANFIDSYRKFYTTDTVKLPSACLHSLELSVLLMFQAVPGHLLGRLGKAVSESMLSQQENAKTPLQPLAPAVRHSSRLAPGPLGIASAVNDFVLVVQTTLQRVSCLTACRLHL